MEVYLSVNDTGLSPFPIISVSTTTGTPWIIAEAACLEVYLSLVDIRKYSLFPFPFLPLNSVRRDVVTQASVFRVLFFNSGFNIRHSRTYAWDVVITMMSLLFLLQAGSAAKHCDCIVSKFTWPFRFLWLAFTYGFSDGFGGPPTLYIPPMSHDVSLCLCMRVYGRICGVLVNSSTGQLLST